MILDIDLELIKQNGLTPTLYSYLVTVFKKEEFPWKLSNKQMLELQSDGWIKIGEEEVFLRQKAIDLIKEPVTKSNVEDWIDEYRELFPKGIKSGGRPVRGDKQGCIKKMNSFIKNNKHVTREQIFDAAKAYVFEMKRKNYNYMVCADYFISKDGVSLLSSLIEHRKDREQEFNENNNFHTTI